MPFAVHGVPHGQGLLGVPVHLVDQAGVLEERVEQGGGDRPVRAVGDGCPDQEVGVGMLSRTAGLPRLCSSY
ncbi:hypothetical protein CRV15_29510 (plasmid) [Streptomyces clavuligerus]|nr:hypothetical protein CRV15_29510 [Streptomyces clavuligerus]